MFSSGASCEVSLDINDLVCDLVVALPVAVSQGHCTGSRS